MSWFRPLLKRLRDWAAPSRVTGQLPLTTEPCDFCGEIELTTVEEVWSRANRVGRFYRLCGSCKLFCGCG